jgi:hypothetical protein
MSELQALLDARAACDPDSQEHWDFLLNAVNFVAKQTQYAFIACSARSRLRTRSALTQRSMWCKFQELMNDIILLFPTEDPAIVYLRTKTTRELQRCSKWYFTA